MPSKKRDSASSSANHKIKKPHEISKLPITPKFDFESEHGITNKIAMKYIHSPIYSGYAFKNFVQNIDDIPKGIGFGGFKTIDAVKSFLKMHNDHRFLKVDMLVNVVKPTERKICHKSKKVEIYFQNFESASTTKQTTKFDFDFEKDNQHYSKKI